MKIAALDLATNTGVAVGIAGFRPTMFSERMADPGADHAERFAYCLEFMNMLIRDHRPDLIVIEEPIPGGVKGGKERIFLSAGFRACVFGVSRMRRVRVDECSVQSVRKHFIGHGTLPRDEAKRQVFAECERRGWTCTDDNQSDAAAVWDYACAINGFPVSPGGLFK